MRLKKSVKSVARKRGKLKTRRPRGSSFSAFMLNSSQPLNDSLVNPINLSERLLPELQTNASLGKPFERLPKNVVPSHYQVTVEPDLVNLTFDGQQLIEIEIREDTDRIVLNSLDLDIKEASFKPSDDGAAIINPKEVQLNKNDEQLILVFPSRFKAGTSGQLSISFSGVLTDKLRGFYRAKYPQTEGQPDKYAAVTHFEPTAARRAFPCWDEPAIKATFAVTLIAPQDQVTLSNMPVAKEEIRDDGKKVVSFDVTPIMSTYLVAFVVGEYDFVEMNTTDGSVLIRVYTPPGKKDQGQFSLEVAAKVLPFFTEYFNVSYPLPKMDMIAVSDFGAAAMENWGLVTYREVRLLVDPENTSALTKQNIALVIAHELAHQWFGNLVTMEWWEGLWLNEGFATFSMYLCVDYLFPEYHIWQSFVTDIHSWALDMDGLKNSHPIEVPVDNPADVAEIFDAISYDKGAAVIRMLHNYIGDEAFRKGMSLYLNRFKYNNTVTDDLWTALGEASGKPVRDIMTTWIKEKGYPVISVSEVVDGDTRVLNVSQEKFSVDGILSDSEKDTLWTVPLTFTAENEVPPVLLTSKQSEVRLPRNSSWVKVNKDSIGFYRVHYSQDMLQKLMPEIESKKLPPLDRINVLEDMYALAQAGKSSTVGVLMLLEALKLENEYPVWSSISSCLGGLNQAMTFTDFQNNYHDWGRKLVLPIFMQLGWQMKANDTHSSTLMRSLVLSRLAIFEEPSVVAEAKNLFQAHINGTAIISPNIRSAVYSAVARNADAKTFNIFVSLYKKADTQEEKRRLCYSMTAVPETSMLERVLAFAMSDDVRSQDAVDFICRVSSNKHGRELAWQFFQEKSDILRSRYETGTIMSRLAKCVTQNFASEEKAKEVEAYFAKNPIPGTDRSVQQSLEDIRLKAAWLNRDTNAIKTYLNNSTSFD